MSKTWMKGLFVVLAVLGFGCSDDPVNQGDRLVASASAATGMNEQVALTAQEPAGGTPPYVYQWHMSTASGFSPDESNAIAGATELIHTVSELDNGTTYFFRLVATDEEGESVAYSEISATPTAALVAGIASATPGNGQIALNASPPSGGEPPYTYQWHRATTSNFSPAAANALEGLTSLSVVDEDVSNGTVYFYRLVATDAAGASAVYAQISAAPGEGLLPGTATATPLNGAVALSATSAVGGTPPYLYQWFRSTTSGFTPSVANALAGFTDLTETDASVTNGTTYFYRLGVADADSTLALYGEVSATPSAPLTAGSANASGADGQVVLSASAATGGTPPYTYQWYRSTASGFIPGDANALAGMTDLNETDTDVSNGTEYFYRIVATDAAGDTAASAEADAIPAPVSTDYPNRPTGMQEIITFTGTVEQSNGDAFGEADFGGWLMDPSAPADMIAVVDDPTNPTGSGSSLRFRYSEQFNPRSGIASANTFSAGTFDRLYVKLLMFYEEGAGDWSFGHKIFYVGAAPGSRNNTGSPTQSYNTNSNGRFRYHQQNFGGPEDELVDSAEGPPKGTNASAPIATGRWVMLEHLFIAESAPGAADGQVHLYVDGELVGSRTGVSWVAADDPAAGFNGLEWYADVNEVPGGDVFYRLGELYVAGD